MARKEGTEMALDNREVLAGSGGGAAVLDRPADAGVNGTGGEAAAEDTRKRGPKRDPAQIGPNEIIGINVRVPNGLRAKLTETATEQNTSVAQLVATMLASAYEYELPKPGRPARVKKYANEEERKQAQKDAQAKQRKITRAILKAVENGQLNLNLEELVAQLEAEEATTANDGAE